MISTLLTLLGMQLTGAPLPLPPEDALSKYVTCVSHSAVVRRGNDPSDITAATSAVLCENFRAAAVQQVSQAMAGTREEAEAKVGSLLEVQARREAVARNNIIQSYENERR